MDTSNSIYFTPGYCKHSSLSRWA